MNEDRHVVLRAPIPHEIDVFLGMFRDQLGESEGVALEYLGLSWEELARLFTSVGEIRAIDYGDDLAGFVWIELRERELHVHGIVLLPRFRGKGIGHRVFDEIYAEFEGRVTSIELAVQEENRSAIGFYRHLGFQPEMRETAPGFLIFRKPIGSASP